MQANLGQFDPALLPPYWKHAIMLSPDEIMAGLTRRYHVSAVDLKGPSHKQHVAFVRQIAMYLLRECTDLSTTRIGLILHRDHSTIIHGCNVIAARMAREPAFAAMIEGLKGECG